MGSLCLTVKVRRGPVGCADMFKHKIRKSRKNILSLIEIAQEKNEDTEEKQTKSKAVKKKNRKESVSPRDEGYNTGNEKIYETPRTIEDDFYQDDEGCDVETDKMNKEAKLDEKKQNKADANQHKNPPIRNQTAAQTDSIGLHLIPVAATVFRRSSPEEDFLWTLRGVQNLIDQQNMILTQFECKLETKEKSPYSDDGLNYLTIPRPKIVRRDCERKEMRREEMERRKKEMEMRRKEMESLRQFQERMGKKLVKNEEVLYQVCDL